MGLSVTWLTVAASEIGTSHITSGTLCQDSCLATVEVSPDGKRFLMAFVADGAGSASHGGVGAELAIEAAARFVNEQFSKCSITCLGSNFAAECLASIKTCIEEQADLSGHKPRDYACTFLGVISTSDGSLLMQIGDGGIVVDVGDGLWLPIVPMTGEYANMTNFVTDENAADILATKLIPSRILKLAAFSDGIQRLAINMAENQPHSPFFSNFFNVIQKATADQEDALLQGLRAFLKSDAVNSRTNDDKTLVLAHWIG